MNHERPIDRVVDALRRHNTNPTPAANGYSARCPAHDDRNPSLSVRAGDDGRALVRCHAGCDTRAVVEAIGLGMGDLFEGDEQERKEQGLPDSLRAAMGVYTRTLGMPTSRWDYHDRDGQRVGIVLRWDIEEHGSWSKTIRPLALIDGAWQCTGMPSPRPVYRLPEVLGSTDTVIVCEGEKACDAAVACGYAATTSPHGSKGAAKCDWSVVRDRDVVIVPDLDEAGMAYAREVHGLLCGVARSVKIVDMRDGWAALSEGDDLDDALMMCDGDVARAKHVLDGLIERSLCLPRPAGEVGFGEAKGRRGSSADGREARPHPSREDACHLPHGVGKAQEKAQEQKASTPTRRALGFSEAIAHDPSEIRWLVDGRVAMGKLNVLAGDPGLGKSFISLELAARVSRGEIGRRSDGSIGTAVILSAEDDAADTMVPRLIAMGADRTRIRFVDGFLDADGFPMLMDLKADASELGRWIEDWGDVSLIVIDPISAYMGETDSHKNAEVRGVLGRLAQIGEQSGAAVVCVTHLNKDAGSGKKAIYRTMGSLAFTAAARVVQLVTTYDGDDAALQGARVVSMVKNNLGPMLDALVYRIDDGRLQWLDTELAGDADVFANGKATFVSGETKGDRAAVFLEGVLVHGAMAAREVYARGEKEGLTKATLHRAKESLNVATRKVGRVWYWSRDGDFSEIERCDAQEPTLHDEIPPDFGSFGTY